LLLLLLLGIGILFDLHALQRVQGLHRLHLWHTAAGAQCSSRSRSAGSATRLFATGCCKEGMRCWWEDCRCDGPNYTGDSKSNTEREDDTTATSLAQQRNNATF